MKYEIVTLQEKKVVGVACRTGNEDPNMGAAIGALWGQFYQGGVVGQIKNRANEYAIGLYSDYEGDTYQVTVGAQVSKVENDNLTVKVIPAGTYAKFSVHGDMVESVGKAWADIWQLPLNRTYTGDFEEYVGYDGVNADVDIYVAIEA